jgi:probable rRNA maturation factor
VTPPELDLAFEADDDLPAGLRAAAGALADPDTGEELWQRRLGKWLGLVAADLPEQLLSSAYSLGLQLVSDEAIADLNRAWRAVNGPTDVLAFAAQDLGLGEAPPLPMPRADDAGSPEPLELGDIVISLETAARQAEEEGHGLEQELLFLASHGLLHLLGWDHPDEASLAAMLERQEQLLAEPSPVLP